MVFLKTVYDRLSHIRPELWICLFLILANLVVYHPVRRFDFIGFDDHQYVSENPQVRNGLSSDGLVWAFTTPHVSNWHPLTWLSHMLDIELYGMHSGAHHLTNLQLHIANTLLLFLALKQMTKALWRSAAVAALFALHPLHVESVAWVAERKDVLSTFFWLLTLLIYAGYVRRPTLLKYFAALLSFGLGLMAKAMPVTLPFTLLFLDYWPLGRFQNRFRGDDNNGKPRRSMLFLIYEKVPFFVLSFAVGLATILAQYRGGAISSLEAVSIGSRIANALVSYVVYIRKMIWPAKLAVVYPYSYQQSLWQITGAALILLFISLMVFRQRRRQPFLIFGWLWYLVTLIPVIGLVQIGVQSMADRYTYVPLIGLFIMLVWWVPESFSQRPFSKIGMAAVCAVLVFAMSGVAWRQVRYWENTLTLFERTLKITDGNYLAHNILGCAFETQSKDDAAIEHFRKAVQINPDFVYGHYNLGRALARGGKTEEAVRHHLKVLQLDPMHVAVRNDLGNILSGQGRFAEAADYYADSLRLGLNVSETHNNLGIVLFKLDRAEEAIQHFLKAVQINPEYWEAYYNLGNVLAAKGRIKEAISRYRQALRLQPDSLPIMNNLRVMRRIQEERNRAVLKSEGNGCLQ